MLLYYNAELEHESEGGRTPLMKACRAGHICTVKFLISKGADVNRQTTNNDHTPLSLACAGGHQTVVELLLKSGADPFHKLKDNSTMLIEAAKGGHIGVVQLLLDYPHSMGSNLIGGTSNSSSNTTNSALQQQQQQLLLTQKQQQIAAQQQQLLTAPPGLQEVPEAVRVSNQQMFHQQQILPKEQTEGLQQQPISNLPTQVTQTGNNLLNVDKPNCSTLIESIFLKDETTSIPSVGPSTSLQQQPTQQQQPDSILTHMRLLQMQAGFKEGLAHGLARAQPGINQQVALPHHAQCPIGGGVATSTSSSTTTTQGTTIGNNIGSNGGGGNGSSGSGGGVYTTKQKSLYRHKNRVVTFDTKSTTSSIAGDGIVEGCGATAAAAAIVNPSVVSPTGGVAQPQSQQQVRSQPIGEDDKVQLIADEKKLKNFDDLKKVCVFVD